MTGSPRLGALWIALVVAGCSAVSPALPSLPLRTPPATPSSSSGADLSPCRTDQLRLTAGQSGGVAGTNYLIVFVELNQGPACALPGSPMVTIIGPNGSTLASASETDSRPIALTYITRYYVAWSGNCQGRPTGPRSAHIEFSATATVDLLLGDFGPSCVDGAGQSVSMYADEPD